jgi:hypothetical protein
MSCFVVVSCASLFYDLGYALNTLTGLLKHKALRLNYIYISVAHRMRNMLLSCLHYMASYELSIRIILRRVIFH